MACLSAITGFLVAIMGCASAHEAQYAAGEHRLANRKPRPPMRSCPGIVSKNRVQESVSKSRVQEWCSRVVFKSGVQEWCSSRVQECPGVVSRCHVQVMSKSCPRVVSFFFFHDHRLQEQSVTDVTTQNAPKPPPQALLWSLHATQPRVNRARPRAQGEPLRQNHMTLGGTPTKRWRQFEPRRMRELSLNGAPRPLCSLTHQRHCATRFGPGPSAHETTRFRGPSASHLHSKDHETPSCDNQSGSVSLCSSPPCCAITTQSANENGVDGQLDSNVQWKSINDHFQAPPVNQNVCRNTTTCFTTNSIHHAFQSVPPSAQNPRSCARYAVMAKGVQWTATPAGTHGWGKGHLQATEENDSKQVCVEFVQPTSGASEQRQPNTRTTLGPHQNFRQVHHSREDLRLPVGPFNT